MSELNLHSFLIRLLIDDDHDYNHDMMKREKNADPVKARRRNILKVLLLIIFNNVFSQLCWFKIKV